MGHGGVTIFRWSYPISNVLSVPQRVEIPGILGIYTNVSRGYRGNSTLGYR
jgi:hypothetical protein